MRDVDPWDVDRLDLTGYLGVVGLVAQEPSVSALGELHAAHVRAFPFENLDVLLGQHPGVALEAVQDKFVVRRRGGYCFEHGTLLGAVLQRLGYDVRRHLGRVGDPPGAMARTHTTLVVELDGERWLCDPGFGMSLRRPIRLRDGAELDDDGWHYRVRAVDQAWALERRAERGWELMHTTDELPVHPIDLVMGHHFTSTFAGSFFTQELILTRHLEDRHVTVTSEAVTVRRPGEPTEHRDLEPGELAHWFDALGVTLPDEPRVQLLTRFGH